MRPLARAVDEDFEVAWLRRASVYLAWGSTLLLSGALVLLTGSFLLCYVFTVGAVAIHAIAWAILYHGVTAFGEAGSATDRPTRFWNPRRAQRFSVALFVGASLTVPLQFPAAVFSILLLPYVPFVFGPIVLFHAYVFARSNRLQPSSASERMCRAGVIGLVAVSTMGIVSEAAFLAIFPPFSGSLFSAFSNGGVPLFYLFYLTCLPIPAGLTAIGYWLVHLSWRKPRHTSASMPPVDQVL